MYVRSWFPVASLYSPDLPIVSQICPFINYKNPIYDILEDILVLVLNTLAAWLHSNVRYLL